MKRCKKCKEPIRASFTEMTEHKIKSVTYASKEVGLCKECFEEVKA